MHPCVVLIRHDIQDMTIRRYWEQRDSIKKDIKYSFWHGFIDEKIYNALQNELDEKIKRLMDESFV